MNISILEDGTGQSGTANVNEKFIEKLILEVAPRVEDITGWNCFLDDLNVELVANNEQFWKRTAAGFGERLGLNMEPETPEGEKRLQEHKSCFKETAASYAWVPRRIIISPSFFRLYSYKGVDAMAVTLGHELMHRCQYENNPDFYEREIELIKKAYWPNFYDSSDEVKDVVLAAALQAHDDLTEGDAYHIGSQLQRRFYRSFGLREGCSEENKPRKQLIADIQKQEGREGVNRLYSLSIEELYRKLYGDNISNF